MNFGVRIESRSLLGNEFNVLDILKQGGLSEEEMNQFSKGKTEAKARDKPFRWQEKLSEEKLRVKAFRKQS